MVNALYIYIFIHRMKVMILPRENTTAVPIRKILNKQHTHTKEHLTRRVIIPAPNHVYI